MIIEGILPTLSAYTAYFQKVIRDIFGVGKVAQEAEEERIKAILEHKRKMIKNICNVRGKIIDYFEVWERERRNLKKKNATEGIYITTGEIFEYPEIGSHVDIFV